MFMLEIIGQKLAGLRYGISQTLSRNANVMSDFRFVQNNCIFDIHDIIGLQTS